MAGLLSFVGLSSSHPTNSKGPTFSNQLEFILSVIGYSVGLGDVWQFTYFASSNGNGTFLIPYFIMNFFVGIPLLLVQLFIGQWSRRPCTAAYESLAPIFKGIGWAMIGGSVITNVWYGVMTSWVVYYTYKTILTILSGNNGTLPWLTCKNEWMSDMCWDKETKNLYNSSNYTLSSELFFNYVLGLNTDGIQIHLVLSVAVLYISVFLCVHRGIKTSGKVVYFTATYPYFILLLFLYPVCMTKGAGSGVYYFFTPQMDVLLKWETWSKAAAQAIFSLSTGYGTHIMMASHSKFLNDVYRDSFIVAGANVLASLLSTLITFQVLGYLSHSMNRSISEVLSTGPAIAFPFVAFQSGLDLMAGYLHLDTSMWAFLFFSMVLFAAIDSQFGRIQNIASVLRQSFSKSGNVSQETSPESSETRLIFTICLLSFFTTIPLCFSNGLDIFHILHESVGSYVLMPLVLLQLVLVTRVYGWKKFFADIQLMLGYKYKMNNWISMVHYDCTNTKCAVNIKKPCIHRIVMGKIEKGREKGEKEDMSKLSKLFGPTGHWVRLSLCYISPVVLMLCFVAAIVANVQKQSIHSLCVAVVVIGFGFVVSGIKALSLTDQSTLHEEGLKKWLRKLVKSDFPPQCELPRSWLNKEE